MNKKSPLPTRGEVTNNQLVRNLLLDRALFLRRLMDPRRDIDAECGHPTTITIEDYTLAFLRGDLATRVVSVWPEESWSENPFIFENEEEKATKFEQAWVDLEEQLRIFSLMQRADILSGVGRFGVILLGLNDGAGLDQQAPDRTEGGELLFLRAFDEILVKVTSLEKDITDPRYGQPDMYEIQFADANELTPPTGESSVTGVKVHWSRIIHLADNRTSSEVYGRPRMERVFNRILDVKKIAGGSGEMFWKGGFPGLSLETHPSEVPVEIDQEATKAQMEAYQNGLQRYLALTGMQAKSLITQVANPTEHVDMQVRLISLALGVPWRIFVGSEAAQLASEQDSRAWYRRLARRRQEYLTPFVILPMIERLVRFGVLPKPAKKIVFWRDLNTLGDKEKSDVAEKKSNALAKYVTSGSDLLVPPFHYLTLVMGMTDDEARAVIDEAGDSLLQTDGGPSPGSIEAKNKPTPAPARRNGNSGSSRIRLNKREFFKK